MKIVGITGGIGSGKSRVLQFMKTSYNACVIEADSVAHELMKPGAPAYMKIIQTFPKTILDADGVINRKALSELVFKNPIYLKQLNNIVHPEVKAYILQRIQEQKNQKDCMLFVIEAALLIEDGYTEICDEIWYIYAEESVRICRLMNSRGYTREKCLSVIKNQSNETFYRENTASRIDNSASFEDTEKQIDALLKFDRNCDKL